MQRSIEDLNREKQIFKNLIDKLIDSETCKKAIKELYDYGEEYRLSKRYDKALYHYDQILALDSNNAEVFASRGVVYQEEGEWDKAELDLNSSQRP